MNKFKHDLYLRVIKLLNVALATAVFSFFWMNIFSLQVYQYVFYRRGNWLVIALFAFLYFTFGRTYDAFQVSLYRISEMVYSQLLALIMTNAAMTIVIWLLCRKFPSLWSILVDFVLQMGMMVIWDVCTHKWYFKTFPPRRTIIIYDMREGMEELISQYGLEKKFDVECTMQIEEAIQKGTDVLRGYEAVYLCGIHSHDRNILLKYCIANKIPVFLIPRIGDVLMTSAKSVHIFHLPVLRVERYSPLPEYLAIKRFFDILLSGIAIVILSPFMLIIAFMVRRDGGPALYKQVRLTKDGKEFELLKFRSMRVDAEKDGVARLSSGENDDRITPVGRFIRKVRLDELPQLFNIFFGDMSIVGPRPERPEIAKQYEEELPEFALRLQAKAGLTGLAQVYGKYNTIPYDKLMMDLMYIAHPSIFEDMRIILATIKILFLPESTEGVSAGQVTAMDYESSADSRENEAEMVEK